MQITKMEIEYAKYYFIEWTILNEWYSWISRIQTNIQYYNDSSNINNSSRCKSMSIDILDIMGYSLHLFYRYIVFHSYSYVGSFCKLYNTKSKYGLTGGIDSFSWESLIVKHYVYCLSWFSNRRKDEQNAKFNELSN